MSKKWLFVAAGALACVIAFVRYSSTAPAATHVDGAKLEATVWKVPVLDDDPKRGAQHPLVTIIQFDDMGSPACVKMDALLREALQRYPDELQWVWKDRHNAAVNPLGLSAAVFARYAFTTEGNSGFWRVHDAALKSLASPNAESTTPVGALFGMEAHEAAVTAARTALIAKLESNMQLALALGVRVTPHLLINGRSLSGLPTREALLRIIEEELAAARARVKRGEAREDLYAKQMEHAEVPMVQQVPATYGAGRVKRKNIAETELDIAARDTTTVELSSTEIEELKQRGLTPEGFQEMLRLQRARQALEARSLQARQEAGLQAETPSTPVSSATSR